MIIKDWPCNTIEEKWDVYKQIMMNVDVVTQIFKANISKMYRKNCYSKYD